MGGEGTFTAHSNIVLNVQLLKRIMSNALTGTEAERGILKIFIKHLLFAKCCPGCFAYVISFNCSFLNPANPEIQCLNCQV